MFFKKKFHCISKATDESFDVKAKDESEAAIKTVKEMMKLGGEECECEDEEIFVARHDFPCNGSFYIVNASLAKQHVQQRGGTLIWTAKEKVQVNKTLNNLRSNMPNKTEKKVPEKIIGWRMEEENLKLGYNDNRPIVIGETLSVLEDKIPKGHTPHTCGCSKTIAVGNYGLHAYGTLRAMIKNQSSLSHLSMVELSGKKDFEREGEQGEFLGGRIAAESRRCLGLVKWRPIFKQLCAKLTLPVLKELIKKYPELQMIGTDNPKKEDIEKLKVFLKTRVGTMRGGHDDLDPWFPPYMNMHMIVGPMAQFGCRGMMPAVHPPKEYSALMEMLAIKLGSAQEKVLTELLGIKVFEKAKKYAEKIKILEKALKEVSDLKLNELPKFFAERLLRLHEEEASPVDYVKFIAQFILAVQLYDSFDLATKVSLEASDRWNTEENWSNVIKKHQDEYNKIVNKLYQTLEDEFKKLMAKSLKMKAILTSL